MSEAEAPDVREMLSTVVPDLPVPADRLADVRLRAQRAERGRLAMIAGAAVVVVVALVMVIPMWWRGEPVEPFMATGAPGGVDCPEYDETKPTPGRGATGPVVPEGAERATLCVYRPDPTSGWRTDPAAAISQDVADVISSLNALPDYTTFVASNPAAADAGCLLSLRPQYSIVFDYPDGSERQVRFAMNCATVDSGDVVRYGEITRVLDEFTEHYRDQGGDVPPSPWKW